MHVYNGYNAWTDGDLMQLCVCVCVSPVEFAPGVSLVNQKEFFNAGHDVVVALSPDATPSMRTLVSRLGADVELPGTRVIDHFEFEQKLDVSGNHTAVVAHFTGASSNFFSPSTVEKQVVFDGVGLSVSPEAVLVADVLQGSPTSYSGKPGKATFGSDVLAGSVLKMAVLIQGRNNARAGIIGSVAMLSDAFMKTSNGNGPFAQEMIQWTFQLSHVLKASRIRHRLAGGEDYPSSYRIKDVVEVEIDIEKCDSHGCRPFRYACLYGCRFIL